MTPTAKAPAELISRLQSQLATKSLRQLERQLGVPHQTLSNALAGKAVRKDSLVRMAKVMPKTRSSKEFDRALSVNLHSPTQRQGTTGWDLARIHDARSQQALGKFALPVQLADAMLTDDAIYTAFHNRVAPQAAIQATLEAAPVARGESVQRKAAAAITTPRAVLQGIQGTMANHGVAIGYVRQESNRSGTLVRMTLEEWPLEFVQWDQSEEVLWTQTKESSRVNITHGDGTWIRFQKFALNPWKRAACLLPASLIWAAHANAISDWAGGTKAHGLAQILGRLPEGFSVRDADGNLTADALAFLQLIQALASGETGAGIAPPGSEIEFLANGSTAWQIFETLESNRGKAAARVYQGTDAALGSVGGAPGVDIAQLFGVATTILQGDFTAIESALKTGLYDPWTAINEGTSQYAPSLKYQLPDPDLNAKRDENAKAIERVTTAIEALKKQKLEVTQPVVDALCRALGVSNVPLRLASQDTQTSTLVLAPTSLDVVVRGGDALMSQGLKPFGDARDQMTLYELKAAADAKLAASNAHSEAQAKMNTPTTPIAPA